VEQQLGLRRPDMQHLTDDYERLAALFRALGHPVRLRILVKTLEGEFCVQDLGEHLDRSQPSVSQHLAVLRDRGVVIPERRGKKVCYRPANDRIAAVIQSAREALD
jgi:DNA-binding transcriptional ArsR family regulator